MTNDALAVDLFQGAIAANDTTDPPDMSGRFASADLAKAFILAGKARLTLRSAKSGNRFTFLVTEKGGVTFVALLHGEGDGYRFIGTIFDGSKYVHSRKSSVSSNSAPAKAWRWAWERIAAGRLPDALEVWHEGRCGRCGRPLTVPESIATGFGETCAKVLCK